MELLTDRALYDAAYAQKQRERYERYLKGEGPWLHRIPPVLESVGEIRHARVLDIGCGVGTFALELAKQGHLTVGIDFSLWMLREAERLRKLQNIQNAYFFCTDSSLQAVQPGQFDVVVSSDFFEHLPESVLQKTLSACYGALKPGGRMVIHTFPTKYDYLFVSPKLGFFVIPFFWVPDAWLARYLDFLDRRVIPALKAVRNRWRGLKEEKRAHCSCLTPKELEAFLWQHGFVEIRCEAKSLYPRTRYQRLIYALYGNREPVRRNLLAICRKPLGTETEVHAEAMVPAEIAGGGES